MSLNSEERTSGSGGGGAGGVGHSLQAPRLLPGGYAAWRPNMDVFLQRAGAEGIHRKPMLSADWIARSDMVVQWADEADAEAWALLSLGSASSSGSTKGKTATAPSDEEKAARKVVSSTVERSRRVFGIIYSSLPEELRAQVAHIASGWAFGLWDWLEKKFQSTEEDSVDELLQQWTQLRQTDDESFDAYRARVNKVATLLEQAKEKQSARMYAHVLLGKLQPRYKLAVLALKAGDKLKDADKVPWDTVTAFINAHERSEQRLDGDMGVDGAALDGKAMAARGGMSYSKAAVSSRDSRHDGGDRRGDGDRQRSTASIWTKPSHLDWINTMHQTCQNMLYNQCSHKSCSVGCCMHDVCGGRDVLLRRRVLADAADAPEGKMCVKRFTTMLCASPHAAQCECGPRSEREHECASWECVYKKEPLEKSPAPSRLPYP